MDPMSAASKHLRASLARWLKTLGVPLVALACQSDPDHPPPVNGTAEAGAPDEVTPGVSPGSGSGSPSSGQSGNASISTGGVISGTFTGGGTGFGGTLGAGGTTGAGNAAGFVGVGAGGTTTSFGFGGNPVTPGSSGGFS
jgi:hypothetical protein